MNTSHYNFDGDGRASRTIVADTFLILHPTTPSFSLAQEKPPESFSNQLSEVEERNETPATVAQYNIS